ncbi:hypothetical protein CALCODRAFT_486895 [Calocera cornea HHB12733]|uniref:Uncharacterized protein n=1 Tax=Calocera cornea HHB12733 TaxID=1353952 RepID=A0A165DFX7_9BASI|nr:hypothetical protein CALCODRAFT_486895 [Calocera cornea HHB12733]
MPTLLDTVCEIVPSDDDIADLFPVPFEASGDIAEPDFTRKVYESEAADSAHGHAEDFEDDVAEHMIDVTVENDEVHSHDDQYDVESYAEGSRTPVSSHDFLEPVDFGPIGSDLNSGAPSQSLNDFGGVFSKEEHPKAQASGDPWAEFDDWMNDPNNVDVS